jgi:hypothetical protein
MRAGRIIPEQRQAAMFLNVALILLKGHQAERFFSERVYEERSIAPEEG